MKTKARELIFNLVLILLGCVMAIELNPTIAAAADLEPALVPWPQSVTVRDGSLLFAPASQVVTLSPDLKPLAGVCLMEELRADLRA